MLPAPRPAWFHRAVWLLPLALLGCLAPVRSCAAVPAPAILADQWLATGGQFPSPISTNNLRPAFFQALRAEAIAGKLKLSWLNPGLDTNSVVTAYASADDPGHWLVRDWHAFPMNLRGAQWDTAVPIDNVDVPLVYFVTVTTATALQVSPMRLCRPRLAGLEESSRIFWPFLDGLELGTDGWRLVAATTASAPLPTDALAKNGHAALLVSLPAGRLSVTVGTTRVRGWQVEQEFATGLRLWVRAKQGSGRVRFTLLANAYGTNQVVGVFPPLVVLRDSWQRVDLPFNDLPKFPLSNLDFFTLEFFGVGPGEFLVDDLSLLGRWKLPVE